MAQVTGRQAGRAGASVASRVEPLMPRLTSELVELSRIPSISEPTFPPEPVYDAFQVVSRLLREAGVQNVGQLHLPNTFPIATGEIPAPDGAPTVLLYGHYDVVPPGDESKWVSPPFEPTERDGALYGRGTSDSKANVLAHIGALRAFGGRPPVGIKVVIEGQEEVGSAFNTYPPLIPGGSSATQWSSPTWAASDPACRRSPWRCAAWAWSRWRRPPPPARSTADSTAARRPTRSSCCCRRCRRCTTHVATLP